MEVPDESRSNFRLYRIWLRTRRILEVMISVDFTKNIKPPRGERSNVRLLGKVGWPMGRGGKRTVTQTEGKVFLGLFQIDIVDRMHFPPSYWQHRI